MHWPGYEKQNSSGNRPRIEINSTDFHVPQQLGLDLRTVLEALTLSPAPSQESARNRKAVTSLSKDVTAFILSPLPDSNRRPSLYKSDALAN